jgi:hypothetical protein
MLFDRSNNMSLLSIDFGSLARVQRGASPKLDSLQEWARHFKDLSDAQKSYSTLKNFYF